MRSETSDVMVTTGEMVQFAVVVLLVLVVGELVRWVWARRRWLLERAALACAGVSVRLARAACRATPVRRAGEGRAAS
ncbi:hypothetical protein [Actinomyces faecalis]|uniref:hypothetical protein n=1 Tax=Actinomyces faecalis TaxID=2722820 RepID=UPI0015558197|nr:hypothetical protein [Actinomyces faecalis]